MESNVNIRIFVPQFRDEWWDVPRGETRAAPPGQRKATLISTPYEGGPERQADYVQCVHCQHPFLYTRGSGNVRGWCIRCNGMFCGPECETCVPAEQLMKNLEAGMDFEQAKRHRPIKVSVPCAVPASAGGILLGRK